MIVAPPLPQKGGGNVADDKKKRKTHTSSAVKDRYNAKAYDRIELKVPKGKKADLQDHAADRGESLNGFVNRAIDNQVKQDHAVAAFTVPPDKREGVE